MAAAAPVCFRTRERGRVARSGTGGEGAAVRQYLRDAGGEHIAVWPCGAYPPPGLTGTSEESPKGVRGGRGR